MNSRDTALLRYFRDWPAMQRLAACLHKDFDKLPQEHQLKFYKGASFLIALPITAMAVVFLVWIPVVRLSYLSLPIVFIIPLICWVYSWRQYIKRITRRA